MKIKLKISKMIKLSIHLIMNPFFMLLLLIKPQLILAHIEAFDDRLISLSFYQTDIDIILQSLADAREMNLIMDQGIDFKQTVKLNNVSWSKALAIVTTSAKLQADIEDNLLLIHRQPDPQLLYQQKISALKAQAQQQALQQPLHFLSIPIKYTDAKLLLPIIHQQDLLSARGKIVLDERTNTLIIYDISQQLAAISELIAQFDSAMPQVHISAHIVTMSRESISELGVKWGYHGHSSQLINQFDSDLSAVNASTTLGFNLAKYSGNLLSLQLSALEAENQVEIIASPNLLTSHLHSASIKQGTEIPYEVSSGSHGATAIEFKQAVLGLEVTPKILANQQLELNLHITQNTAGRTIKRSDGGEALAIDTQEIRTQVRVKSGETLVLGGIFQQSSHQDDHAVPGLAKVPLIGGLFTHKGRKLQRRELVIFITPHLIENDLAQ